MIKYTYSPEGEVMTKGATTAIAGDSYVEALFAKANGILGKDAVLKNKALDMYKAMDTVVAEDGGNLVQTILFQGILEKLRFQGVVAPLFTDLTMPSPTYQLPVELEQATIFLTPENTESTGQTSYSSSNPTVGRMSLVAKKFTGMSFLSGELEDDAVIDIIRHIVDSHSKGLALGMDKAILDGDTASTHQDADVTGTRDVRTAFEGLRKLARGASLTVDAGGDAISLADIAGAEAALGKYAVNTEDLVWILSPKTYIQLKALALNTTNNNMVAFGYSNGRLSTINAVRIVITEAVRNGLTANAVNTGSGNLTYAALVNTSQFYTGTRAALRFESERKPEFDQTVLYSRLRKGFAPMYETSASETNVAIIRNLL